MAADDDLNFFKLNCMVNSFFPLWKAFVGNGIANEREKWDASIAENMVKVFYEGEKLLKGFDCFDILYCG